MDRVLLPVDDSDAARHAARQLILASSTAGAMEIHVLHVQWPLRRHVGQFISRSDRESFYRDESERALSPVRRLLDDAGVPYTVHTHVRDVAEAIADVAAALGCDRIVMGTTRKSSMTRALESSVLNKVIELTHVPVIVFVRDGTSTAERYAVPAMATGLAVLLLAALD